MATTTYQQKSVNGVSKTPWKPQNGKLHGKGMNAARQISRRFGQTTGARTRSAVDYSITATLSVVPDPLDPACAPDEGLQAVHHEGAASGRELLLPHGGQAGPCAGDGFFP